MVRYPEQVFKKRWTALVHEPGFDTTICSIRSSRKTRRLWRLRQLRLYFAPLRKVVLPKPSLNLSSHSIPSLFCYYLLLRLFFFFLFSFLVLVLIKAVGSISVACTGNCYSVGSRSGRLRLYIWILL